MREGEGGSEGEGEGGEGEGGEGGLKAPKEEMFEQLCRILERIYHLATAKEPGAEGQPLETLDCSSSTIVSASSSISMSSCSRSSSCSIETLDCSSSTIVTAVRLEPQASQVAWNDRNRSQVGTPSLPSWNDRNRSQVGTPSRPV